MTSAFPDQENVDAEMKRSRKKFMTGGGEEEEEEEEELGDDDEEEKGEDKGDDDEDEDEIVGDDIEQCITKVDNKRAELIMWPTAGVSFEGGLGFSSVKLDIVCRRVTAYDIEFVKTSRLVPIGDNTNAEQLYALTPDKYYSELNPYSLRFSARLMNTVLSVKFPRLDIEEYQKFVKRIADWLFQTLDDKGTTNLRVVGRFLYYILSNSSVLALKKPNFYNIEGGMYSLLKMGLFDKNISKVKKPKTESSKPQTKSGRRIDETIGVANIPYASIFDRFIAKDTRASEEVGLDKLIEPDIVEENTLPRQTILLRTLFGYFGERLAHYAKHAFDMREAEKIWNELKKTKENRDLITNFISGKQEKITDVKDLVYFRTYVSARDGHHDEREEYTAEILKKYVKVLIYTLSCCGSNDMVFSDNLESLGDFMKVVLSCNPFGPALTTSLKGELAAVKDEFYEKMQQVFILKISYYNINFDIQDKSKVSSIQSQRSKVKPKRKFMPDEEELLEEEEEGGGGGGAVERAKRHLRACTFSLYTDRMKHTLNAFLNVVRPSYRLFTLFQGQGDMDVFERIVLASLDKLRDAFFVELANFERLRARITTDLEDIKDRTVFRAHFSAMMVLYSMTVDTLRFHVEASKMGDTVCDYTPFWTETSSGILKNIFDFYTSTTRLSQRSTDMFEPVRDLAEKYANKLEIKTLLSITHQKYGEQLTRCREVFDKSMAIWHGARDNIAENRPDLLVFGFDKLPVFVSTKFDRLAQLLSFAATVVSNVKYGVTFCRQPESMHLVEVGSQQGMIGDRDERFRDLQKRASVLQFQPLIPLQSAHFVGTKAFGHAMFTLAVNKKRLFTYDAESYVDRLNLIAHRIVDNISFSPTLATGHSSREPMSHSYENDWHFDLVSMRLVSVRLGILQAIGKEAHKKLVDKYISYVSSRKRSLNLRMGEDGNSYNYLDGERKTKWTFDLVNRAKPPTFDLLADPLDRLAVEPYVPESTPLRDIELYARTNDTLTLHEAVDYTNFRKMKASLDIVDALTDVVDSDFCGYYQRLSTFVSDDVSHNIMGIAQSGHVVAAHDTVGQLVQSLIDLRNDNVLDKRVKDELARKRMMEHGLSEQDISYLARMIFLNKSFMEFQFENNSLYISGKASDIYYKILASLSHK
jgi:hypothetical protein